MNRKTMFAQLLLIVTGIGSPALLAQPATDPFIGTWVYKIEESREGLAGFLSIMSYHSGGTISETPSVPTLAESHAQGIWERSGTQYRVVFQLFIFDEHQEYAGMVRVRATLIMASEDRITGKFAVDLIHPDGFVEADVDYAEGAASRLRLDSMAAALPTGASPTSKSRGGRWSNLKSSRSSLPYRAEPRR